MSLWLAVGLSGLVSAALRVVFVAGSRRIPVPQWFDGASRLIAPAFTAAVVAGWAFAPHGHATLGPEAAALAVATPVALRTRSVPLTLAVGLVTPRCSEPSCSAEVRFSAPYSALRNAPRSAVASQ